MKKAAGILITIAAVLLMAVSAGPVFAAETETNVSSETPAYKNEWVKKGGKYYYYQNNGEKYTQTGFKKIDGEYYYFTGDGSRINKKGFRKIDGKYYYFQKNGKVYKKAGLKKIKGAVYCFTKKRYVVANGAKKTKGVLHVYGKTGKMLKKKRLYTLNGKYYRIDSKGKAEKLSKVQAEASRLTWVFINKYTNKGDSNAVKVLRNKGRWTHNCYGFACTIASLARELGYKPYVCVLQQDHAVVQINGKYYDNMGARFGASSPAIKGFKIHKKYKF